MKRLVTLAVVVGGGYAVYRYYRGKPPTLGVLNPQVGVLNPWKPVKLKHGGFHPYQPVNLDPAQGLGAPFKKLKHGGYHPYKPVDLGPAQGLSAPFKKVGGGYHPYKPAKLHHDLGPPTDKTPTRAYHYMDMCGGYYMDPGKGKLSAVNSSAVNAAWESYMHTSTPLFPVPDNSALEVAAARLHGGGCNIQARYNVPGVGAGQWRAFTVPPTIAMGH